MAGITQKHELLKDAEAAYKDAKDAEAVARSNTTAALNRLNEAQREFDKEVGAIKDRSPGGDWKERHERELAKAV